MTSEDFGRRLEQAFTEKGVPYQRVHEIFEAEGEYGQHVVKLRGYLALSDAFKCLFLETVELLNTYCRPKVTTPLSEHYPLFLLRLTNAFHSVCGAERAATNGYPLPAYTLLRNVYDNNVLTAAAIQKITTFYAIEGIDPNGKFDPDSFRKDRKREEFAVVPKMTGKESGLSQGALEELRRWDDLFDTEVHGGRLSLAAAMGFMKGKDPLPVMPKWNEMSFALFMNRFIEVGWTIHRLLPLVQPPGIPLPVAWAEKWKIVDECYEAGVRSLSQELNKKIGDAFAELVNAKFHFDATSTFPL